MALSLGRVFGLRMVTISQNVQGPHTRLALTMSSFPAYKMSPMLLHQAVQDECSLTASRRQSGAESALLQCTEWHSRRLGLAWVSGRAPLEQAGLQKDAGTPQLSRISTHL